MELNKVYLYRMTHIENIPHILTYGITHHNSPNANAAYRTIGDASLISNRNTRRVYIDNGTLNQDGESIILGNFIPFYLGVRMPMLYVIQHGGNFVPKATPATDIVYLVCHLLSVVKEQSCCYYSNGHATEFMTSFFDKTKIQELPLHINWEAIIERYWGGEENLKLKWQKQAEFLAKDDISPTLITGFVCHDETAQKRLIAMGIEESKIKIVPNAYY